MRWTVEGAHEHAGHEIKLSVEAATQEDAIRQARKKGVLVAKCYRAKPAAEEIDPMIERALQMPAGGADGSSQTMDADAAAQALAATMPPPGHRAPAAPEYRDVVKGAGTLNLLASLVAAFGWILILIGGMGLVVVLTDHKQGVALAGSFLSAIVSGIGFIVAATFMRMNAALALAVRDIARNSFGR